MQPRNCLALNPGAIFHLKGCECQELLCGLLRSGLHLLKPQALVPDSHDLIVACRLYWDPGVGGTGVEMSTQSAQRYAMKYGSILTATYHPSEVV